MSVMGTKPSVGFCWSPCPLGCPALTPASLSSCSAVYRKQWCKMRRHTKAPELQWRVQFAEGDGGGKNDAGMVGPKS